jgi:hypothetical protein
MRRNISFTQPQERETCQSNLKNFFLMNCEASIQVVRQGYRGPIDKQVQAAARRNPFALPAAGPTTSTSTIWCLVCMVLPTTKPI